MTASEPVPGRTLAVLLGAGWYSDAPKLAQGVSFENSARDFRDYLISPGGLGLPRANISYLFDDTRWAADQLRAVGDFLQIRGQELQAAGTPATDLIVYYVGHGLFSGPDRLYHLAIRATDPSREGLTSIRVRDLAQTLKDRGRFLRKFLILDCCFAAAAYQEFQGGAVEASRAQLFSVLPSRGTALLCAASATGVAIAPRGLSRTMFSNSLLKALETGHPRLGARMSLSELGVLVKQNLQTSFPGSWVRPEIHCPDQREGEIAAVGLFPNPGQESVTVEVTVVPGAPEPGPPAAAARDKGGQGEKEPMAAQRDRVAIRSEPENGQREPATPQRQPNLAPATPQAGSAPQLLPAGRPVGSAELRADKVNAAGQPRRHRPVWLIQAAAFTAILASAGLLTQFFFAESSRSSASSKPTPDGVVPRAGPLNLAAMAPGTVFQDCNGCLDMVRVPTGSFLMGSPDGEAGRENDEGPARTVTISYPLAVSRSPVTRGQWREYLSDSARRGSSNCAGVNQTEGTYEQKHEYSWLNPGFAQDDNHPVVCVTWQEATDYAAWLSKKSGRHYRLLSEAEYEFVERAGGRSPYPWGKASDAQCQHVNAADATLKKKRLGGAAYASCSDGVEFTSPVLRFPANPFGLYDTDGNVVSWTQDCYHGTYDGAPSDGSAWLSKQCESRVVRGASWRFGPRWLRSAFRDDLPANDSVCYVGFRVART